MGGGRALDVLAGVGLRTGHLASLGLTSFTCTSGLRTVALSIIQDNTQNLGSLMQGPAHVMLRGSSSLFYINLYQNKGAEQDGLHRPFHLGHTVILDTAEGNERSMWIWGVGEMCLPKKLLDILYSHSFVHACSVVSNSLRPHGR